MAIAILRLNDVLLTSIQEELTDEEALAFQDSVVRRVSEVEAKGLVVDINALDVVDSFMARVLNETATMVRYLGTQAVICGMQPAVALTLIEMGRELIGVATALNLEQGLEQVKRLIADPAAGDRPEPEDDEGGRDRAKRDP